MHTRIHSSSLDPPAAQGSTKSSDRHTRHSSFHPSIKTIRFNPQSLLQTNDEPRLRPFETLHSTHTGFHSLPSTLSNKTSSYLNPEKPTVPPLRIDQALALPAPTLGPRHSPLPQPLLTPTLPLSCTARVLVPPHRLPLLGVCCPFPQLLLPPPCRVRVRRQRSLCPERRRRHGAQKHVKKR